MPRKPDPRAVAVARMARLRGRRFDPTTTLLAAQFNGNESLGVLSRLEQTVHQNKILEKVRAEQFAWCQELDSLRTEEEYLFRDLGRWLDSHVESLSRIETECAQHPGGERTSTDADPCVTVEAREREFMLSPLTAESLCLSVRELAADISCCTVTDRDERCKVLKPVLEASAMVGLATRAIAANAGAEEILSTARQALAAASIHLQEFDASFRTSLIRLWSDTSLPPAYGRLTESVCEEQDEEDSEEIYSDAVYEESVASRGNSAGSIGSVNSAAGAGLRAIRARAACGSGRGSAESTAVKMEAEQFPASAVATLTTALNRVGGATCPDPTLMPHYLRALLTAHSCVGSQNDVSAREPLHRNVESLAIAKHEGERKRETAYGGWSCDAHLAYLHACRLRAHIAGMRGHSATLPQTLAVVGDRKGHTIVGLGDDLADTVLVLLRLVSLGQGDSVPPFSFALNRAAVAEHHAWAQEAKANRSRTEGHLQQWKRKREQLLSEAEAALRQAEAKAQQELELSRVQAENDAAREAAHRRLELERAQHAVEAAVEAALLADLEDAAEAVEVVIREKRAADAVRRKAMLASYFLEQAASEEQLCRVRKAAEVEHAERRREEREASKERIEHRRELIHQRCVRLRALEAETQELEKQRAALLDRLIASVPYADRLQEIAELPDAGRAMAATASSTAAADVSQAYAAYLRAVQGTGESIVAAGGTAPSDASTGSNPCSVPGMTSHGDMDVAAAAARMSERAPADAKTRRVLTDLANQRIREQGLFGGKGFTDKQVTSSASWRFVSALRAAGVAAPTGSVARQALGGLARAERGAVNAAIMSQGGSGFGMPGNG